MRIKLGLAMVCVIGLALVMGLGWAQSVPQLINYQGQLQNAAGQPLDGVTVNLTFTFYGAQSGGTVFLTVQQSNVAVSQGIYNVLIGSGVIIHGAESSLSQVFQKHQNVWIGVKVNADPEMTPRSRISSVPYALNVNMKVIGDFYANNDWDGDGYTKNGSPADCNDGDATIHPGALEIMCDGIDQDCDGLLDDDQNLDGDPYSFCQGDCDDTNSDVYPGAAELCDGIDNQCPGDPGFGTVDEGCQAYYWTWMSGSTVRNQHGVYGTKGTPDPANIPGGRYYFGSWRDTSGNMWLFGGGGYAASGSSGYLNDLWKYNGTNWTWISGSNSTGQGGVYGTKGTPDPANVPGARQCPVSWEYVSGNMWLFGGNDLGGLRNDLWRYDGTNWTWMSGGSVTNQHGVYGTKGTPAPANIPGCRDISATWIDVSGNLWLFGGDGYAASGGTNGPLNDLWKYDGTNWTWISGSTVKDQLGVYGTKGTPAPANVPGSRISPFSWIDLSGNLWLFGGYGYPESGGPGYLNDLWKYDGTNWTWISGSKLINQNGVYGTKGTPAPANIPGGRESAISWIDASGNMWFFGGFGYDASGGFDCLNDLWKYDGTNWTWISGSNVIDQHGVYGTKGTPDPANVPGARGGAVLWIDSSGNLWLFGGTGFPASGSGGPLNDLWRFY